MVISRLLADAPVHSIIQCTVRLMCWYLQGCGVAAPFSNNTSANNVFNMPHGLNFSNNHVLIYIGLHVENILTNSLSLFILYVSHTSELRSR